MTPKTKCFLSFVGLPAAALVLTSCATTPPPAASSGFAGGSGGSDLVIKSTGFRFPARIGVFVRAGGHQYDAAGQDLSVKYQAGAVIVADIYDYPTGGKTLGAEFANRKDEIKSYHADARLLREEAVTIHSGGKARHGRKAVFAVSQGYHYSFPPPYQSDLLVFQRGNRFLEYRFSYSAAHREAAESEIAKFVDALAWPAD